MCEDTAHVALQGLQHDRARLRPDRLGQNVHDGLRLLVAVCGGRGWRSADDHAGVNCTAAEQSNRSGRGGCDTALLGRSVHAHRRGAATRQGRPLHRQSLFRRGSLFSFFLFQFYFIFLERRLSALQVYSLSMMCTYTILK